MPKPSIIKATFFAVLLTALNSLGQVTPCSTYTCDSLAVRAILDINGLDTRPVEGVTRIDTSNVRIVYLQLSYAQLTSLPPEIGQLTALKELDNDLYELDLRGNQLTRFLKTLFLIWLFLIIFS